MSKFIGRSLDIIESFTTSELLYLLNKSKELKQAILDQNQEQIDNFRIDNNEYNHIYDVFIENSTRTKESFRNAISFHRMQVLDLMAESSSLKKLESYTDTFNNLIGYGNRIFIIRSNLEGVCRHLDRSTKQYRERNNINHPVSFINAGDGNHQHPTQELLDEFTFLEYLDWSNESIHIALIGDLLHGRTIHSKCNGLNIFKNVTVDLIAPKELALPLQYLQDMQNNNFNIRTFASIQNYLQSDKIAPQWYFTRIQKERLEKKLLDNFKEIIQCVQFQDKWINLLPNNCKFYHPLPRNRENPTIPSSIDSTHLNGWENQSANGFFIRTALISLLGGKIGSDYYTTEQQVQTEQSCFEIIEKDVKVKLKNYKEGIIPIKNGIVIDHIMVNKDIAEIRNHMNKIINILQLNELGGEWICQNHNNQFKGLIFRINNYKLEDIKNNIEKIAALAPNSTLNVINNNKIQYKYRLYSPKKLANYPELICNNTQCISHPQYYEQINKVFTYCDTNMYRCDYCDSIYDYRSIWTTK